MTTYNRRKILERTFPTLVAQDFPAQEWEIVVVDDGSIDGTREYLLAVQVPCAIRVISQENRGQVRAQDFGLQHVRGKLVLLLDDENLCSPTLVHEHVAAHVGNERLVVFGRTLLDPTSRRSVVSDWTARWFGTYDPDLAAKLEPKFSFDMALAPNSSVSRKGIVEAQGFDEQFGFA
jgi:glycosyltransferase involved in cell wall biosynthesis